MRTVLSCVLIAAAVLGQPAFAQTEPVAAPAAPASAAVADTSTQATQATAQLYVLNTSGPTLIASNQDLTDNGRDLASLPRNTYQVIAIPAGEHEFRFRQSPTGNRVARLSAKAGKTYYLAAGYSPGKSWAFPFGGDPVSIRLIAEDEAQPLLAGMKAFTAH